MVNPFLTLIQCIGVLYLNNRYPVNKDRVHNIVSRTLETVKLPNNTIGDTSISNMSVNLKHVASWMLDVSGTVTFDKVDILRRVKLNVLSRSEYLDVLEELLDEDVDSEMAVTRISSILSGLQYEESRTSVRSLISKVNHQINFSNDVTDYKETLRDLKTKLDKFTAAAPDEEHTGFIGRVSSNDARALEDVFIKAKETRSSNGIMRTGYAGLNRMTGVDGLSRGELVNFGALTHHYKSGMLLSLTRHLPMYNTPWMWDKKKKPLILRVSFENRLEQDVPILYKAMVEQDIKQLIDVKDIDPKTAVDYITTKLSVNGYTVMLEAYDSNNFTIYDLLDLLHGYESEGYEIHAVIIDYMELIARASGGDAMRGDESINLCFEVIRNHCFGRGITVCTGHQLSTEAQRLSRDGSPNFVRTVAEGGWYRNSQSLHTKLDLEVLLHIHKVGETSFLTAARGKHRGGESTLMKHRFYFQPFHKVGGLWDDADYETPECHHGSITEYINESAMGESHDAHAPSTQTPSLDQW